jgi:hypothetical protein
MVLELALASKFANAGSLEDMCYSALAWWYPPAKEFVKALRKGAIF